MDFIMNVKLLSLAVLVPISLAAVRAAAAPGQWQEFTSKHGQCKILMPDNTTKTRQESGSHQTTSYLGTAAGTTYEMAYTVYAHEYLKKRARTRLLKEAIQLSVSSMPGKVTAQKTTEVNGNEAIDFDFEGLRQAKAGSPQNGQRTTGHGRVLWANGIEYLLLCKGSAGETTSECSKFMESFKINATSAEPVK